MSRDKMCKTLPYMEYEDWEQLLKSFKAQRECYYKTEEKYGYYTEERSHYEACGKTTYHLIEGFRKCWKDNYYDRS